jgi:hypothetical protein
MNKPALLAALNDYWRFAATDPERAHAMYLDDAILEFPQSQERFEGKANFLAWRKLYPADVEAKIRRVRGGGDFWVAELSIRYDGGAWNCGCTILEFRDEKIARETIYFAEGWLAPEWRSAWRAPWRDE